MNLSAELENVLAGDFDQDGIDIRNYGGLLGLEGMRQLGSEILGCKKEMVIAGGNSSLTLMAQYVSSLFSDPVLQFYKIFSESFINKSWYVLFIKFCVV